MEDLGFRKRGEFLCGARIVNPHAHEFFNMSERDIETSKYQKVNCKKCIEIARKRWQ
jgi:hypothetical protein